MARLACSRDELLVLLATAPGFPVQEGPEAQGPAEVTFRLSAGTPRLIKIPEGAILRDLQTSLVLSEVITTGHASVRSYSLDGKELWRITIPGTTMPTPSAFAANGMLFVGTGAQGGEASRPFFAVRPGASGCGERCPHGVEQGLLHGL